MTESKTLAEGMSGEDWSGAMGEKWLANLSRFEGIIAPIGEALFERSAFTAGERVIAVGCGGGWTSIEIARRVGPGGEVFGLDISPVLVDAATKRARAANVRNVRFHCADAATFQLVGVPYDHLFSRFGLMFFPEPAIAFANLHRLVKPGARADFAVWAPARDNPWVMALLGIIGQHVELPPPVPHAPGPFAFDDQEYLRGILEQAGFGSPQFQTWQGQQFVAGPGASPQEAADFALRAMHFGELLQKENPGALETARAQLAELFAKHKTAGGVAMSSTAYLVSARA